MPEAIRQEINPRSTSAAKTPEMSRDAKAELRERIESLRFENYQVHQANIRLECRCQSLRHTGWVLLAALVLVLVALAGSLSGWLGSGR